MISEIWVNYQASTNVLWSVSNFGNIISYGRKLPKQLKGSVDSYGYLVTKSTGMKTLKIHRLIASLFIPNPNNHPQVNHINGIKTDNRVENLEWCSSKQNIEHSYKIGLTNNYGELSSVSKLTEIQVLEIMKDLENGLTRKIISKKFNVSESTIGAIRKNLVWKKTINEINPNFNPNIEPSRGEKSNFSKLTEEQVKLIIKDTSSLKELSNFYNVHKRTIQRIKKRQIWKHVV